jgi:DNA helicase-2/ATP-dependent DNA helicase PcrA
VICNPLDEQALLRIINVPRRGISDQALDKLTQLSRIKAIPLWHLLSHIDKYSETLSNKAIDGIKSFVGAIEEVRHAVKEGPASVAAKNFLEKINYKKAIFDEVKSDRMRQFKWENVERLLEALATFEADDTSTKEDKNLIDFLRRYQINDIRDEGIDGGDRVQLMTLHSAKGLEFTACFMIGVEDHLLPHEKSTKPEQIEEERRLFYVGITRAKEFLTLSMSQTRKRMGQVAASRPSRFLFEIPKELLRSTSWNDPTL